jgi:hypothetical protein
MVEETKTTLPKPVVEKLEKLAAATQISMKQLVKDLKEFIDSDASIQAMTNKEHQITFACTLLIRRYSMTGGAKQMYLRPLSKPRARQTKSQGQMKYVGGLYALVKLIERNKDGTEKIGEVQYAAGTIWEKAADKMRTLSPNKVYKTSLRATDAKNGLELGANDASFVEVDYSMPTKEEYFNEHIKAEIPELLTALDDLKINQRDDQTDIRVVKGTVLDASSGTSAKMGEFGRYSITDDSFIGKDNFPIWVHPDEVEYGVSSDLYFIGTVSVDNSNPEKPVSRFDCHFVMPAGATITREEEPTPIQKESEEISLDDISGDLEEEPKEVKAKPKKAKAPEPEEEFAI